MPIYRYWSGIYHFFDSFGDCGKRSGIGMVLVFFIVLIVWEEPAGGRSHRKSMKPASQNSQNAQICVQKRSKIGKYFTITSILLHVWREVRFWRELKRSSWQIWGFGRHMKLHKRKWLQPGVLFNTTFLINLGNGFWFCWGAIPVNNHHWLQRGPRRACPGQGSMASWWLGSRLRSVIILMHVAVGEARVPQEPRETSRVLP